MNAESGRKLLLSIALIVVVLGARYAAIAAVRGISGRRENERLVFWTRQITSLGATGLLVLGLIGSGSTRLPAQPCRRVILTSLLSRLSGAGPN